MTENEKLRALLAEALDQHAHCLPCVPDCVWTRIDAALAEPVGDALEWQTAISKALSESQERLADEVRNTRRERDEARAEAAHFKAQLREAAEGRLEARVEVERLKSDVAALEAGIAAQDEVLTRRYNEQLVRAKDAYQRGAEAMREAAAVATQPVLRSMLSRIEAARAIRALPLPEDKP